MVKKVLVTGHTKGVGKEITGILLKHGYDVVGIARTILPKEAGLVQYQSDLSTQEGIAKACKQLKAHKFDAVLLNAGYNNIKPPEGYLPEEIFSVFQVNLVAHACIVRATIAGLLETKGHIIGIGSVSGTEVTRWNNYYGAAKAGFHHLLNNLFEQYRKQGLKVTNVVADIIKSNFYEEQVFEPTDDKDTYINPADVAEMICKLLTEQQPYVTTQITIRPQKFGLKRK